MSTRGLTDADRAQLVAGGITIAEAERQLTLLRHPPAPARLLRPCTVGDGIERLSSERQELLLRLGDDARRAGRLLKFVPASGAASRMFRSLAAVRQQAPGATGRELAARGETGDREALEVARFVAALPRLALGDVWSESLGLAPAELQRRLLDESIGRWLATLLDSDGLDAAAVPKALLPFHRAAEGARTAFAEQLREGLAYLVDENRAARFHFTIPPGSQPRFERELAAVRERLGADLRLEVAFSEQSPASRTLALDAHGAPARNDDGQLLLRPAGHGALLANLEATGGDLVLIKNIDNLLPESRHAEIGRWKTILAGRLVELISAPRRTRRPARVVGVVPNTGEPGGGPFWIEASDGGVSPQIVEGSQVDHGDSEQRALWRASTHFNPVDLACALRDDSGRPYPLAEFVDPATAIVTRKSEGGRALIALERPGLWNGAMAGWETVFVELPGWTFAPVKTALDLAREEHLPT